MAQIAQIPRLPPVSKTSKFPLQNSLFGAFFFSLQALFSSWSTSVSQALP
jgi:hypothetical protein